MACAAGNQLSLSSGACIASMRAAIDLADRITLHPAQQRGNTVAHKHLFAVVGRGRPSRAVASSSAGRCPPSTCSSFDHLRLGIDMLVAASTMSREAPMAAQLRVTRAVVQTGSRLVEFLLACGTWINVRALPPTAGWASEGRQGCSCGPHQETAALHSECPPSFGLIARQCSIQAYEKQSARCRGDPQIGPTGRIPCKRGHAASRRLGSGRLPL